jgi:trans-aconitate 2-methyltransferase
VTAAVWNPTTYLAFADERSRPFADLTSRVGATAPRRVVDLGCGPGQLTAGLAQRWPGAEILGLDSSPEMIEAAQEHAGDDRVRFAVADLRTWTPDAPVDVIVTNATLQWVPDHLDLLPRLVDALAPDGWLALQVPANFGAPSHRLLYQLAADPRFATVTAGLERPAAPDATTYLAVLAGLGLAVDAWETTYLHVLKGPDPVFRWISGTGARPVLQALSEEQRAEFEPAYKQLLRDAYPEQPHGTVLPFRRTFAVAHKPGESTSGTGSEVDA